MKARIFVLAALLAPAVRAGATAATPAASQPPTKQQLDFFEAKVRPVLSANCYQCHSIERGKAKGGLTLDTRQGWEKGGKGGAALTPGEAQSSRLITAIHYTDPDLQMPPDGKLSDKEIATLEQWVNMGAPDPRTAPAAGESKLTGLTDKARAHWAYQPVRKPDVPQVKDSSWVKTPVDAFILSRLEQNGMTPSAPAAREALIRRATYDLTGLPPTPEEVRAFVNDGSADAFEKVVDRLLASPQYGERWGRFWLDTARYADTTGGENKREDYRYPYAWTYRDYVIQSFNADKPYDVFLKEQIAADLLPGASEHPERLAALGFLTVGKRFQNPNDTIDERIDTLSKATLGLTVACARCHDHKFDPIPTADYYALHGIFASTVEPSEKPLIGAPPTGPEYAEFESRLKALEAKNRDLYFNAVERTSNEFRNKAAAYLLVASYGRKPDGAAVAERNKVIQQNRLERDMVQNLGRVLRQGEAGVFAPLFMFAQLPKDQFADRAPELLSRIARGGPPRRPLNRLVVEAFRGVKADSLHDLRDVVEVYAKLFKEIEPKAKAYLAACRESKENTVSGFDPALVQLISIPAPVVPAAQLDTAGLKEAVQRLPMQNNGYNRFLFAEINELQLTHPGSAPRAMVVTDSPNPHDSPIFVRGEAQNRGPVVPRRFLEILSGKDRTPYRHGSGRLELAEAIANKDNPLTARVTVNRVWMHHLGEAFVRTPDDLGVMSEPPSHPELLDYLASRFMEDGWSLKKLHKLIMLSAAYQQSSNTNPAYAEKDPENRLLWRANLRRLDFEAVRDSILMFTGKMDLALGGKPVNLTDEPYSNRRSVYGYVDRGDLPELMAQFDFADPDRANSRRATTIVPQQALFFMNSPMAVDVARKVTSRPEFMRAGSDAERVKVLYEVLFQRPPRPEEIRLGVQFIRSSGSDDVRLASGKQGTEVSDNDSRPGPARNDRMARRDERRAERLARTGKPALERPVAPPKPRQGGRAPIRNEGDKVERRPMTAWEQYAQSLLFTNEIVYVN